MRKILAFLTVILIFNNVRCWDLATAVNNKVELIGLKNNGTRILDANFSNIRGLAYNYQEEELYVVEGKENNSYILSYQIGIAKKEPKTIVIEQNTKIEGIAYDSIDDALYWTTGKKGAIMWFRTVWHNSSGRVLHQFETNVWLQSIAVDSCDRYLYWINNKELATIERSKLDDFKPEVLINKDLYNPRGIAVDWNTRKIFWCEDSGGETFKIERSDLDGTHREVIHKGTYEVPHSIIVFHGRIFWMDTSYAKLLSLKTTDRRGLNPATVHVWGIGNHIRGVVPMAATSCVVDHTPTEVLPWTSEEPTERSSTEVDTQQQVLPPTQTDVTYCLNNGRPSVLNNKNSIPFCDCPPGYGGARCELPRCHNYCVHGTCQTDRFGQPVCNCLSGYDGDRCEHDLCDGHCANGGVCHWNASLHAPTCRCPDSRFGGARCTENLALLSKYCQLYCQQKFEIFPLEGSWEPHQCNCPEVYHLIKNNSLNSSDTSSAPYCPPGSLEARSTLLLIISISLGCVLIAFLVLLAVMAKRIHVLSRRPRIKKRIIVNKKARQQELSDRRTSGQSSGEQCEITIENCCNMNICETPCFETPIRPGRGAKTEEKKNLLGSMEGGSAGASSENSLY